jgi:saccharopine dehydrogenase-like NADP-dependent oxidoreductase
MKVVQLGCGVTGIVCAQHLNGNRKVDELVLADAATNAAHALASRLKGDKVSVKKVDAASTDAVKRLIRGADILVSALPSAFSIRVIKAAAKAGVDYVDFSMSWESVEAFSDLDRRCREGGITALTAMGCDPGISDVFARYAASKLDAPEEAYVRDGDNGTAEGQGYFTVWSPLEMLEEATMPAAIFRDGKISYLPPLHRREIYEFPPPIGPLPVYNTSHEETFLMPKYIKGIRKADFKIAIDDEFVKMANLLRKMGMASADLVDVKGVKVRPIDVVAALMPRPLGVAGKLRGHSGIVVEVIGWRDGAKRRIRLWTSMSHEESHRRARSNATGFLVGTGGAVGAELILSGEFERVGLSVPEHLPAESVLRRLPAKGLQVFEDDAPAA